MYNDFAVPSWLSVRERRGNGGCVGPDVGQKQDTCKMLGEEGLTAGNLYYMGGEGEGTSWGNGGSKHNNKQNQTDIRGIMTQIK